MMSHDSLNSASNISNRYCLAMFFFVLCFPAIAQNAKPPMVSLDGDFVRNNASVSITAFAITAIYDPKDQPPGMIMPERATIYFDSLVEPRLDSIASSKSQGIAIVKNVPSRMEFLAAVFEDGSTYGDPDGLRSILDRRKTALAAYQDSIARLEADLKLEKSNQQIESEFKRVQTTAISRLRDSGFLLDIYNLVIKSVTGGGPPSRTLDILRQRMDTLLNSKPSLKNVP
jgi:hypothetical protein